jgi:hypothetical protein
MEMSPMSGAIGYVRDLGMSRATRKLRQAYFFDRRRIYLIRGDLRAIAQWPIDTSDFAVRLARPDDPLIESFPDLSPSTIATSFGPDHLFFVTAYRGTLVAYYSVSTRASMSVAPFVRRRPDQIHGVNVYVRREFRRLGLSRITRIGAARDLVGRGFHELLGTEIPTNHPAIIANERAGFTRLGTLTRTCTLGRLHFWATPATTLEPRLVSRQLKLLRQVAPAVSRVGVLVNPSVVRTSAEAEETAQRMAGEVGVHFAFLPVREADDQAGAFEAALSRARDTGVNGLIVVSDPMMKAHRWALVSLAGRYRLPAIFDAQEFVAAGGLMSCEIPAPILRDFDSLVASYDLGDDSGRTKAPADELDLALNRSAAATLGLAVLSDLQIRSLAVPVR